MALEPGTRLGRYEIVATLGAGGMGEVYRAYDPRLGRQVAIKVMRGEMAGDRGARERFARETRVVASLAHPNIIAIHDVGTAEGSIYAVMELLDGQSLRARLEHGPLPWRRAVEIAAAIADGLAAAHAKGIVHHDLKPGNVFLARDGTLKVLDFGLAALRGDTGADAMSSETRSHTHPGPAFGTAAYMAPEQVAGRATDARSDIFALGCVLHEMTTGRRTFARSTPVETMAAILNEDPPDPGADAPFQLRRLIEHCLEKDPAARFQSTQDLAFQLRALLEAAPLITTDASPRVRASYRTGVWLAAGAISVAAVVMLAGRLPDERPPLPAVQSYLLPPTGTVFAGLTFASFRAPPIAVSPDGEQLVMAVREPGGKPWLWIRRLDALAARRLDGTEDAAGPFWSPDSRYVGFSAGGQIKTIAAAGGPPETLCDGKMPSLAFPGAAWSAGGDILFGQYTLPILRLPASGGSPVQATTMDRSRGDTHHCCPAFLPDGRHFLYFVVTTSVETTGIYLGSLDSTLSRFLVRSTRHGVFAPSGHLLFRRGTILMAAPFDSKRLIVTGESIPLTSAGDAYSLSLTGTLVYGQPTVSSQLVWVDRQGRELEELAIAGADRHRRLSNDGRRLAATVTDPHTGFTDIWVYDLIRQLGTQLTFHAADEMSPVWSSDDERIVFTSNRRGRFDIYEKPSDGTAEEVLLYESDVSKGVGSWSRDMRHLIFNTDGEPTGALWRLTLPERTPTLLVRTASALWDGQISPDGRFVAYMSAETAGSHEVYVQSLPSGPRWRVSTAGGRWPKWRSDGKELFFVDDGRQTLVAVDLTAGGFDGARPRALFPLSGAYRDGWFNTTDGQRFLFGKQIADPRHEALTLVQNWPVLMRK